MTHTRSIVVLATGALLAGGLTAPTAGAAAAARPDLKVTSVKVVQQRAVRGTKVTVKETTANIGAKRAGSSRTGYWLSQDRKKSRHDRALTRRKAGPLKPGRHSATSRRVTVPANTPPGRWYLIACADATKKVREKTESNNCRATRHRLTVAKPTPGRAIAVSPAYGAFTVDPDHHNAVAWPDDPNTYAITGPDGTTYSLSIPATAVNQAIAIKLTPVTSVAHAPMSGGLIGGVRIEPTGVELNKLATLTITPPHAPDWARATGFRFFDTGSDFGMIPLDRAHSAAGTVSVPVGELATYVVGRSSDADRATVLAHPPVRPEGAHLNRLAALLRTTSARVHAGRSEPGVLPTLAEENAYYDHTVRPALQAALTNDATAPQAVYGAFAWLRELALFGMTDGNTAREVEATRLITDVMVFAADSANARCRQHSLPDIARLLAFARWFLVLGDEAHGNQYFTDAQNCGRFEVRFDDDLSFTEQHAFDPSSGIDAHGHWTLSGTVPIGVFDAGQTQAPLNVGSFSFSDVRTYHRVDGPTCTISITGQPGPTPGKLIARLSLDLRPNTQDPAVKAPLLRDGRLELIAGGAGLSPIETYAHQDTCSGESDTLTDHKWEDKYHFQNPYDLGEIPIPRTSQDGQIVLDFNPDTWTIIDGQEHRTDTTHVTVLHVPD